MRRPLLFAAAFSAALASPAGLGSLKLLGAEKPRVAHAVASFLDSLVSSSSRSHGPTCGCGSYAPQPEPTCEAEPYCGVEPTCGVDAEFAVEPFCGAEPVCGVDSTYGSDAAFEEDAFVHRKRMQHVPIRMRIQSHPAMNVDRTFAPAHRLPPAPRLPSVESERKASPFQREREPASAIPMPELMPEPPVASMPLPSLEALPEIETNSVPMPAPEPMPEPVKNDPVQAAPLPRPEKSMPEPPAPVIEEPATPAPEASKLSPPEVPLTIEEPAIPTPTVEPLPTPPSEEFAPEPLSPAPPAAKLTPEPRRQAPPRPLSNSLPYDPTDPFADPPASEAPATPTSQDRAPARSPTVPEIPRFGEEEFLPVGTGVVIQPTSGVMSRLPAVRPALRIVPAIDLPLNQAR